MRVAVPTAVHHSRDRCFSADADPPEGVRDIHDTEFFEMSLKMSSVSPLDVSSDFETGREPTVCLCVSFRKELASVSE